MIVPSFVHEVGNLIMGPAAPIIAGAGFVGMSLMIFLPKHWPLALVRKTGMTPAGQPASTSAPQSSGVDN